MKIADLDEIKENECIVKEINGKKIAVYKTEGRIYVFDAECTHMKGPLCKGRILHGHYVQCPWHGATFDLETGEVMSGPTKKPIKIYKTRIEKNELHMEEKI